MYHTILVPLDGSALSEGALPTASLLARRSGATLVLVRALWPSARPGSALGQSHVREMEDAEAYLEAMARHLAQQGLAVEVALPQTAPVKGILAQIKARHADLVVMTTHGRSGFNRWRYGSVAEGVLRHSPVPIWLVRAWGPVLAPVLEQVHPRVLAPLDGSPMSEVALSHAAALADVLNGTLVLLHVLTPVRLPPDPLAAEVLLDALAIQDESAARQYLEGLAAHVAAEGVRVELAVRSGDAVEAILAESWASDIGLVVMATHGWTGLERLLFGSVATEILHRGACPLVVIRPSALLGRAAPEKVHAVDE